MNRLLPVLRLLWLKWLLPALLCLVFCTPTQAQGVRLPIFEIGRYEDALALDFSAKFELSSSVEDAVQKGVALVFVAQASVWQDRWYWRDKLINTVQRSWRLSYQPLTRKYRVSFGGLAQYYDSLADALNSLSSSAHWRLADAATLEGNRAYVEFSYGLDTSQLPRPMQIGIGGQTDWSLRIERSQRLP
jgi:hypothetical protein